MQELDIRLYNEHFKALLIDGRADDAERWLATMTANDIQTKPSADRLLQFPYALQNRRTKFLYQMLVMRKGPESTEAAWRCYRSTLDAGGVLEPAGFDVVLRCCVSAEQQASVLDDMAKQGCEKTAST